MYVEEVILEGFKSYATRTVITGFDPYFNAITGLNGSGKSNILDAICFVLGITNLSQVRVSNLQELVYKQGQAGVSKASVTIVFNNENTKQSPVGYEQYKKITVTRQVVIGGRNKYLVNGINATAQRIQNLFHSVQLNVNNPHFLIMQGKITRVINMKPPEILGLIEEAAGTRMYENKKQSALKTIQKKDKKVEEIKRVLEQEITPTLENLRQERAQYTKWTNNQQEVERLSRFTIAFEYTKSNEILQTSAADLEKMEEEQDTLKERSQELSEELVSIKHKIQKLLETKEKEIGSDFKKMEAHVNKLSKEFVKCNSEYEHMKEALETENQRQTDLEQNAKEVKETIQQKKKELEDRKANISKLEEKVNELNAQVQDQQRRYQAASIGMSADEEGSKTLTDKLMDSKKEAVNAATELKQAQLKIKHLTTELKEHRKLVQTAGKEYLQLNEEISTAEKELSKLKKSLDGVDFNEEREAVLLQEKKKKEEIIRQLQMKVDDLSAKLAGLRFDFSDPTSNFDRSKVKGLVANLISINDSSVTMALEVTAGGKLYNVVVDTEVTSKQLIDKGKLKRRVTIIPLNKINSRTIDPKVVKLAEKLVGSENVTTALSLVEYDKELTPAMKYVFGNTFVCQDMDSAKRVTFHNDIRTKSVTIEGDIFDPAGTLTGGSRSQSSSTLVQLQSLNDAKGELLLHQTEMSKIVKELTTMRQSADKYKSSKKNYEIKFHEVEILKQRLSQNAHHQMLEKVKDFEVQLEKATAALDETKEREINANKEAEKIESQMKNFNSYKETQLKETEANLNAAKTKYQKGLKELKGKQTEIETVTLEIEELQTELTGLKEQITSAESSVRALEKELKKKEKEVSEKRSSFQEAEFQLETKKQTLLATDKEIAELSANRDQLQKELTDGDIEMKRIEGKIVRYHKEKKDAAKFVEHLEQKYTWIATEKQYFGKAHTDYDFKATNPQEAQRELTKLQEEQAKLSKTINKKVMSMYEKAEQEYKELVEKKEIIEKDKSTIESFINELDEKKNEALKATWVKVNRDFGSIFSTLLPGTTAKLDPPEGKSVLDGLEMKVAFGDVWKGSLSELSGGQRSLLALSLILSLLLFKPAPMYILDEIDAALDLNHTQNIGQMLKTHFSASQFLVVSLKEDMFKNANVLFQCKFVDGVSCVTRTKGEPIKKKKDRD